MAAAWVATWFDSETGCATRSRTTTRYFKTIEMAKCFAKGKRVDDIYVSKGKYAVNVIVHEVHDEDEGKWFVK